MEAPGAVVLLARQIYDLLGIRVDGIVARARRLADEQDLVGDALFPGFDSEHAPKNRGHHVVVKEGVVSADPVDDLVDAARGPLEQVRDFHWDAVQVTGYFSD